MAGFMASVKADAKDNKRIFFLSFFTSCLFCLCLPVNDIYVNKKFMPYQPTPALFAGIVLGALLFYLLYRWLTPLRLRAAAVKREPVPWRRFALYAMAPVLACVLSCIALFPGIFSVDSLSQLRQAMGETGYNAWHPLGHTLLFFSLPFQLTGQIVSVTVAHLLFYCFTWAYLFSSMEGMGLPRRWLLPLGALIVFIPTNLFMSMAMWKDIPFSGAGAMLTVNFVKLYRDKSLVWRLPFLLGTGSLMGLLMILRHNGPIIVPVIAVLLLIVHRRTFWRALIPVGVAAAFFLCVQWVGFGLLHAKPNPEGMPYRWFTQIAGGILANNGEASEEDLQKLDTIMPRYAWSQYYNAYLNDPLINIPGVKVQLTMGEHKRELVSATLSLALKNPRKAINAELYITELTWRILPKGPINVIGYKNRLDDYGLQINQDTALFRLWHDAMEFFRTSWLRVPFVSQGLYFFLTVVLFCLAILRRRTWDAALCFAPVLLNVMSLWVSIPSQDYRYVYMTVLAFPLLLAVSFAPENMNRAARSEL